MSDPPNTELQGIIRYGCMGCLAGVISLAGLLVLAVWAIVRWM